jgi:site-specific DNA-methyltransferase (adenine-specific)
MDGANIGAEQMKEQLFLNEDCLTGMKRYPGEMFMSNMIFINDDCMNPINGLSSFKDKEFDLAICDPPYGMMGNTFVTKNKNFIKEGFVSAKLERPNSKVGLSLSDKPGKEYFDELYRVSKNQIIFGMQYFVEYLIHHQCVVIWDKLNGESRFSDFEIAYTSFDRGTRIFKHHISQEHCNRIHPTQKPVALYKWLIKNYCKEGYKILDTHVGSASSLIAFESFGLDYVGFEIDKEYYDKAKDRIEKEREQLKLFAPSFT